MTEQESSFQVMSILDEETVPVSGGSLQWVPLRRRLGIRAFGTNAYRAAKTGDTVIEEHVESPGQEELYVVISGRARFALGEEEVEAPAGTAIFVPRPELRRAGVALEDETVVLAVGGWPDRAYHPLPWEPIYLAGDSMSRGDWAAAAEILEREAGEHGQNAFVQYRLACCHARLGETERAAEELRTAVEIKPALRARAEAEEDLASVRDFI
jgi:hypothetical protein